MTMDEALAQHRYETARRLCMAAIAATPDDSPAYNTRLLSMHRAFQALGDILACRDLLGKINRTSDSLRLVIPLLLAEDCHQLCDYNFYRISEEAASGLTYEEYHDRLQKQVADHLDQARPFAHTPEAQQQLASTLARVGRGPQLKRTHLPSSDAPLPALQHGAISCQLHFPGGSPAIGITVTLGLQITRTEKNPQTYLEPEMHYYPIFGPAEIITAVTDHDGRCRFPHVPIGRHEYIAATLPPDQFDIHTRFLAQGVHVAADKTTELTFTLDEWTSAAPESVTNPFPVHLNRGGTSYHLVKTQVMTNPFYFNFPRQLVTLCLPPGTPIDANRLLLLESQNLNDAHPLQISGNHVMFFAQLPECSQKIWAVYQAAEPQTDSHTLSADTAVLNMMVDADGHGAIIDTGRAAFHIPFGSGHDSQPPLMAVRGEDRIWRGHGRFILPSNITIVSRTTDILETGPLQLQARIAYELSDGRQYVITWTAHAGEAYLLAEETSPRIDGAAFEFSLRELIGGRGFLHWTPEQGNIHWTSLTTRDRQLARLQESVAWWIYPQGFGYAMTADALHQQDYIGIFTQRRGDWIDRDFARIAHGPGDDHRELDWPFPEMVGSTISMITAHTDVSGDAFYRFRFFDGRRYWGILVSTLQRNDGDFKELSAVQHKNSSPRLTDFMNWQLDQKDQVSRPYVVARRADLRRLRQKPTSPEFAGIWQKICSGKASGAAEGVRFAVEGDPQIAWKKKLELVGVAHIRSKMTLLGRDYSDMYSPVGARPITQWMEDYDLIAASGVFTPAEERLVRSFLMLMGHLYMTPDFMNWKFNSRNANFEADRVDVIGGIGLAFHGNPDATDFVRHAVERMEQSLDIYCTPGSGKWYENPACYYLHAAKCRMNLAFHLSTHDIQDPTTIPRLKDFLRWGILLLTPACPHDYNAMRDGLSDVAYRNAEKVRRIAPIGDHAHLGPWVPDHYALMSKLYRKTDPAFADLLLWAWQAGGADGSYYGNPPLLLADMTREDIRPAPQQTLVSRRLEGFGAVFRGRFNEPDEFFLLFKQGPGGYRYHRTEGSIILFADGKPLIYDGGEAGETWRHSTLSFGTTHTPLAAGHIERFQSFDALDFAQGVHPKALEPGEPVFLSDSCEDHLVQVAYDRFAQPHPADVRSVIWVKDDYVLLHDDLALPADLLTHWHLQVVSDAHTGNAQQGYQFTGRFGTDLQVMLPGQDFTHELIEQVPFLEHTQPHRPPEQRFSMRHLMLSNDAPGQFLAILRPLASGKKPLHAALIKADKPIGAEVQGIGIHDHILLSRHEINVSRPDWEFQGRYGAILRRPTHTELILLAGNYIQSGSLRLQSNGPAAHLHITKKEMILTTQGPGRIQIHGLSHPMTFDCPANRIVHHLPHST